MIRRNAGGGDVNRQSTVNRIVDWRFKRTYSAHVDVWNHAIPFSIHPHVIFLFPLPSICYPAASQRGPVAD